MAKKPLKFGGQQDFSASPAALLAAVTEFDSIVRIVPDVESSKTLDDDRLQCVVRPGLSFLRGRLTLTFSRESVAALTSPPTSASIRIDAQGIGIAIGISTSLEIQPQGDGSRLVWNATIDRLKGLVATVGTSLIQAAAEKVIEQCWQRLRSELGETDGQ